MVAWRDDDALDLAGPDPLLPSENQPFENDYYLRHNPLPPRLPRAKRPLTKTMKQWHEDDYAKAGLPPRWCASCSNQVRAIYCTVCGKRTKQLMA